MWHTSDLKSVDVARDVSLRARFFHFNTKRHLCLWLQIFRNPVFEWHTYTVLEDTILNSGTIITFELYVLIHDLVRIKTSHT